MTTENRSIEPLPSRELIQQWRYVASNKAASITGNDGRFNYIDYIATQAAQWGYEQRGAVNEAELQKARDEELEACCEWLRHDLDAYELVCLRAVYLDHNLRAARRPKPKSQAEEALEALEAEDDDRPLQSLKTGERFDIIRAALERLRELEGRND